MAKKVELCGEPVERGGVGAHDDHNTSVSVACWYMENHTQYGEVWAMPEYDDDWTPPYAEQWSVRGR